MGGKLPKQFQSLNGKPVLGHTLQKFEACELVNDVILLTAPDWLAYAAGEVVDRFNIKKVRKLVEGGKTRQDSVFQGLNALESEVDVVLVHDAVRPFVSQTKLIEIINAGYEFGAAILAVPPRDTVKVAHNDQVERTLDRTQLWCAQTPQAFKTEIVRTAYEKAFDAGLYMTDDAALVEFAGHPVRIVPGEEHNIKITVPSDLLFAEMLVARGI